MKKETQTIVWEIIWIALPYTNIKEIFLMSPREVRYSAVFKSEWTFK